MNALLRVTMALAIATAPSLTNADDGFTPNSGYRPELKFPHEAPQLVWKHASEPRINGDQTAYMVGISQVSYGDGRVYFGDDDGVLRALDAKSGKQLWTLPSQFRISNQPTVHKGFVYAGNRTGLIAVHAETGTPAWSYSTDQGAGEANPVAVGNRLLFAAYDGYAYALDHTDGGVEWQTSLMTDLPPAPEGFSADRARFQQIVARPNGSSSDGKRLFQAMFDQSRVVAISIESGDILWTFQTKGWTSPAPTVAGTDRLLVGSQDKHVYCLDRETGKPVWKYKTGSRISSEAAVAKGRVFVPSSDGNLYCLSLDDGSLVWKFKTMPDGRSRSIYSFPIVTDYQVIFATGEGQVYSVSHDTGELIWRMRPIENSEAYTSLVTDGERLFGVVRQDSENNGECAVVALGWPE